MDVNELESDIREALYGPDDWVTVRLLKAEDGWAFSINGRYFKTATRKEALAYLGAFFLKASTL